MKGVVREKNNHGNVQRYVTITWNPGEFIKQEEILEKIGKGRKLTEYFMNMLLQPSMVEAIAGRIVNVIVEGVAARIQEMLSTGEISVTQITDKRTTDKIAEEADDFLEGF